MAERTLAEVAALLEEALEVHKAVKHVVLSTKEGVVVASVSRAEEMDARLLATVSAALTWAGATALGNIGNPSPTCLVHSTSIERIVTLLQPNYQLVIVISKADDAGLNFEDAIPSFQSIATRMELTMSSTSAFGQQTILGRVLERIPEITQAILLTEEGLPLGSVGLDHSIEMAGLASSIFSNGLTFSTETEYITFTSENTELMVTRVDKERLLLVVCRGEDPDQLAKKVREVLLEID
ncbi:MAG: roadblock/LC7 domain-containing protein [Promethearchaeota archaeon]